MQRFVYYANKRSWVESQEQCRIKHTDLAYVANELDHSEITNVVSGQLAWIGLFRDAWRWSEGRDTSFRYWLSGSHDWADCASVAASQQGRWVGSQCDNKATFVCQGGLKVKKMVIRITVRSNVDLTVPTVSEALLAKVKKSVTGQVIKTKEINRDNSHFLLCNFDDYQT
ncbi:C-type lectin domain family 10 member A-like [Centropristis striata]|uniref:C-type lectin domain family 10 member A-like n=1 Tax=Centropristis striata TaxID=184440 RepID=UPI0027DECC0B|nr:C-type lectin domain family 10 member A-like [Centropristis striata]